MWSTSDGVPSCVKKRCRPRQSMNHARSFPPLVRVLQTPAMLRAPFQFIPPRLHDVMKAVDGDYFNVVGLPVTALIEALAAFGVSPFSWL